MATSDFFTRFDTKPPENLPTVHCSDEHCGDCFQKFCQWQGGEFY